MKDNDTTTDTTTETQQPPDQGTPQDRLTSIIDDFLPPAEPAEPEPEPEPTPDPAKPEAKKPAPTAPPKPTEPKAGEPKPKAADPKPTEPKRFKFRGREFTTEELVAQGLLDDALTTAEQFPHLQRKYQEVLEQQRQPAPQSQAQPQAQQPLAQAQIRANYAPLVAESVKAGYLEPDLAELYPDFAANAVFHAEMLYETRRVVQQIASQLQGTTVRSTAQEAKAKLDQTLNGLAGQGDIYAPLTEAKARAGFLEFLGQIDPPVSALTPEWLGRQWIAYNHDAILEATRRTAETARHEDEAARRRARGDGKGSRPTAPAGEPTTMLDTLISGALPSTR